ncbi:uncharacterized protein K441DRAFT_344488 [Cenococcum geophilum 1.58]|uniref:uncharacterized protein n=1 Tax=Cenococcum geophilum 1.58 TaxID=794803 RepID=UPI00358F6FB6|nr:hypothetical protein K441DRAFT_344488 [Cenococcum geophilum 1.58]
MVAWLVAVQASFQWLNGCGSVLRMTKWSDCLEYAKIAVRCAIFPRIGLCYFPPTLSKLDTSPNQETTDHA